MNFFLQLNKKIILYSIILLIIFSTIFLVSVNFQKKILNNNSNVKSNNSKYDILKPKFTINNKKQKISVTAKHGSFMNESDVLLKKDVLFKSKDFKIYSDDVLYNKKEQTAKSDKKSTFISDGTNIKSEGFNIIDHGNIIKFNGKSKILLSK